MEELSQCGAKQGRGIVGLVLGGCRVRKGRETGESAREGVRAA